MVGLAFPIPCPGTAFLSSWFMLLRHQFLLFLELESCLLPVLLHIICYYDFHQGNIFSLDILVTLLLHHQKQPRALASLASFYLLFPLGTGSKSHQQDPDRSCVLLSLLSAFLFRRHQFPRQRKEINTVCWVLLLKRCNLHSSKITTQKSK